MRKKRVKEIQKHEQLEGCHQSETEKASEGKEKGELCLRHKWSDLVGSWTYQPEVQKSY